MHSIWRHIFFSEGLALSPFDFQFSSEVNALNETFKYIKVITNHK